jgi:hypothetical protein
MKDSLLTAAQKERLRQALASGSRLGATDMRLINVDVYRQRLGAEWFKYKNIIHSYAVEAIRPALGEQDFFVQTKSGYAVFFFEKDVSQIRVISERVAETLDRLLAGDAAFGDPPLTCQTVSVNCDALLEQLESESKASQPAAAAERRAVLEGDAAAREQQQSPALYTPFWHARMERIVGSIHVPQAPPALFRAPDRDYYAPSPSRAQEDIRRFNAMLNDAYQLHKAGQSTAIFFSVNFKTFCAPEFAKEYMQVLRQTPASLLKYLTPRFVRIPPGTPQTLLVSRVQALMTVFKHVVLQCRPPIDLRSMEFVPCSIVATSWKDVAQTVGQDARAAEKLIAAFCQTARILRANTLVEAVDSPAAFEICMNLGVEFLSGAAIMAPDKKPFPQRPLLAADIRAAHRRRMTQGARPSDGNDVALI